MMDEVDKLAEHHTPDGIMQKLKVLILIFVTRGPLEPSPFLQVTTVARNSSWSGPKPSLRGGEK